MKPVPPTEHSPAAGTGYTDLGHTPAVQIFILSVIFDNWGREWVLSADIRDMITDFPGWEEGTFQGLGRMFMNMRELRLLEGRGQGGNREYCLAPGGLKLIGQTEEADEVEAGPAAPVAASDAEVEQAAGSEPTEGASISTVEISETAASLDVITEEPKVIEESAVPAAGEEEVTMSEPAQPDEVEPTPGAIEPLPDTVEALASAEAELDRKLAALVAERDGLRRRRELLQFAVQWADGVHKELAGKSSTPEELVYLQHTFLHHFAASAPAKQPTTES